MCSSSLVARHVWADLKIQISMIPIRLNDGAWFEAWFDISEDIPEAWFAMIGDGVKNMLLIL